MSKQNQLEDRQAQAIEDFFSCYHLEDVLESLDYIFLLSLHRSENDTVSQDFEKLRTLKKLLVQINPHDDRPETHSYKIVASNNYIPGSIKY